MAQIQTQTQLSRFTDWGSQPSSTTFWDKLSADERTASIDATYSRKFNDQLAWEPAGQVRDVWNTTVYPTIIKPLLKDNSKAIYRKVKKQALYTVACWMVGREWQSAHPAAVIICVSKRVTKQAVKLIEEQDELSRWGFRVYGYESKISLNMATALTKELAGTPHICGTLFGVGSENQKVPTKFASIGGTIILDGKCYGVTVAHPFLLDTYQDETTDEDTSNLSDDESDGSDAASESDSEENLTLELDTAFVPNHFEPSRLGSIPQEHRPDYYSSHADWALLELETDKRLLVNLVVLDQKVVFPSKVASDFPRGQLWAAMGTKSPVQTKASETICGLFDPRFGLRDVWAVRMESAPGDCGSWVVDANSESIFGVIVAGMDAKDISYALPASVAFHEIRERFPNAQLPSLEHPLVFWEAVKWNAPQLLQRIIHNMSPDSLNARNSEGWSALSLAADRGYEEIVLTLLLKGADTESLSPNADWTPLVSWRYPDPAADNNHSSPDAEEVEALKGWGELFKRGKPTQRLSQFLRGVALHLIENYLPADSFVVTPDKLQRFYRETQVPGDPYPWQDIFDDRTSQISRLFRSIQAQHHLVQDERLEVRPDIPSLTAKGFERWATVMIQAHPNREHKRFQKLLQKTSILNPDNKSDHFPTKLPRQLFPRVADLRLRNETTESISRFCALDLSIATQYQQYQEEGEENEANYLTPLGRAARNGHLKVVSLLCGHGADAEATTTHAPSPLELAAMNGHEGVVKLLLEQGASPDLSTESGLTPHRLATTHGHEAIDKGISSAPSAFSSRGKTLVENIQRRRARARDYEGMPAVGGKKGMSVSDNARASSGTNWSENTMVESDWRSSGYHR
ncbi:hypothetical protein NUU61_004942 [Penicillium alfredii]|uniref:DUF7514 domain-containing protein n=1 Tax=Penicillium alfredii TaxID=1506179 RepID=A0A9W9F8I8_9EURO|nr:uncharacterized protein NUU61_004942 [Penicillium alfredii]KAJ5095586.1 hypothetical protein NUU61_004942 [Penicillium alfredii]